MKQKLELISFNLCPFVQRSVITLLEKDVDFKLTYIDLKNPPDWFTSLSPLGKVPLLKVDNTVLFESAVINEYLDEITPPPLHPLDPLLRATNRAWIEYCSNILMNHHHLLAAKNKSEFNSVRTQLSSQMSLLEKTLQSGPFFNGEKFSLIDTAYAPLFMRIAILEKLLPIELYSENSKIGQWANTLATRESVIKSVIPDFSERYQRFVEGFEGYYAHYLHQ
jgi:glutathione S-transferase